MFHLRLSEAFANIYTIAKEKGKQYTKTTKNSKKKFKMQTSKFKIQVRKIFKVQNPKLEIQNPKILFRDYVHKNLKISRPETMSRKF